MTRFLRALLLAVLALGLNLPSGFALQLCLCAGESSVFHSHAQGSCCQKSERSCCAASKAEPSSPALEPATLGDSSSVERAPAPCSKCIAITTPRRDDPRTAETMPVLSFVLVPSHGWSRVTSRARETRGCSLAQRTADPPHARRNVPLRP